MSASGFAHIVAGVPIEDFLEVKEAKETRELFDTDTGQKLGEFETTQYTYILFGKEMPIKYKEYPKSVGHPNRRYGWNMQKNFYHWMLDNGFLDEDFDSSVRCVHAGYDSWPVRHPKGILGAQLKDWATSGGTFVELSQEAIDNLIREADELLQGVDCPDQPKLYFYAQCG